MSLKHLPSVRFGDLEGGFGGRWFYPRVERLTSENFKFKVHKVPCSISRCFFCRFHRNRFSYHLLFDNLLYLCGMTNFDKLC